MSEPETRASDTPAAGGAPPLGTRPAEPQPGKASLADPQGRIAAAVEGPTAPAAAQDGDGRKDDGQKNGDGKGGVCPDCGLPYSDHPDFAGRHDPAQGHAGHRLHGDFSRAHGPEGSESRGETRLPGSEIDPRSLGGDPGEP